jgi:hypothetical protein
VKEKMNNPISRFQFSFLLPLPVAVNMDVEMFTGPRAR